MTNGRRRRLLVPGLTTLAMLATLLGLGTWQVSRLAWKQELIAAIDAAGQRPPLLLAGTPEPFARVRAEGNFDAQTALYGAEVRTVAGAPAGGAHLLAILRRPAAPPVLVDRGWVPVPAPTPAIAPGPTVVEGYVRPAETRGAFTPADDLDGRRFFTLDPAAIGAALGVPDLAPFVLVAMGPPGTPDPARALPRPVNNHLSYAITWYSLAIVLVAIFALHARKVLRA